MMKVLLINLDRSTERLARMTRRLNDAGLEFERVAAVDGATALSRGVAAYRAPDAKAYLGRALLPGEIGCYLSHIEAARRFVKSGSPWGLVLEDDARVPPDLADVVKEIVAVLPADCDIVNLSRPARRRSTPVAGSTVLRRAHYYPVTTTALLWSRAGAIQFLRDASPIRMPIDVFLQAWACKSGRGFAFVEPPVPADESASVINRPRNSRTAANRVRYFTRRIERMIRNHRYAKRTAS